MSTRSGLEELWAAGLVMQAGLDVTALPDWITDPVTAVGVDLSAYQTLVMLGQGGAGLWETIGQRRFQSPNPFDDVSRQLVAEYVAAHLDGARYEVVYPGPALLPLGRMAELAGWGRASPLGLTINERYGLWIAHRIVFLVDAEIEIERPAPFEHPCESCVAKPCVAACPASAVDYVTGFDVTSCVDFRLEPDSACAYQCLARNACPVGTSHRYGPEQMRHHYGAGLDSIRLLYDSDAS